MGLGGLGRGGGLGGRSAALVFSVAMNPGVVGGWRVEKGFSPIHPPVQKYTQLSVHHPILQMVWLKRINNSYFRTERKTRD